MVELPYLRLVIISFNQLLTQREVKVPEHCGIRSAKPWMDMVSELKAYLSIRRILAPSLTCNDAWNVTYE